MSIQATSNIFNAMPARSTVLLKEQSRRLDPADVAKYNLKNTLQSKQADKVDTIFS